MPTEAVFPAEIQKCEPSSENQWTLSGIFGNSAQLGVQRLQFRKICIGPLPVIRCALRIGGNHGFRNGADHVHGVFRGGPDVRVGFFVMTMVMGVVMAVFFSLAGVKQGYALGKINRPDVPARALQNRLRPRLHLRSGVQKEIRFRYGENIPCGRLKGMAFGSGRKQLDDLRAISADSFCKIVLRKECGCNPQGLIAGKTALLGGTARKAGKNAGDCGKKQKERKNSCSTHKEPHMALSRGAGPAGSLFLI